MIRIMEPLVIFLWEGYLIAFGLKIRRVAIDPCIAPVILADDVLKVLVPVSYTHLDVYKRQEYGSRNTTLPRTCPMRSAA